MPITFTKVSLPYGWLGNMSPHPVVYNDQNWRTAEALFQALRFSDDTIREAIRQEKSPMGAKMRAKANARHMTIAPMSASDIGNMELVLRLKLQQHESLQKELLATGDELIVEDVTNRPTSRNLFWGMALVNGQWVGENVLGHLWMRLRAELECGELNV